MMFGAQTHIVHGEWHEQYASAHAIVTTVIQSMINFGLCFQIIPQQMGVLLNASNQFAFMLHVTQKLPKQQEYTHLQINNKCLVLNSKNIPGTTESSGTGI